VPSGRRPAILQGRVPTSLEDLIRSFYPDPRAAAAAGRLWRGLESTFGLDLHGLAPDDRVRDLVGDLDSLSAVELIAALELPDFPWPSDRELLDATFGELVQALRCP
jgi:hypothetical protein